MQTSRPTSALPRNLQLDVLRGVAILMVLVCHSIHIRQPTWDAAIVGAGWSGVDLFFVVSGFLISGLLFSEYRKTGRIRFRRFAVRRAIKIYPAFFALVVVTVAMHFRHSFSWNDEIWRRLLHDIFFVQSYFPGTWGHFWSLSVEEHFYILLPVTMFLMIRFAGKRSAEDPFTAIPKLFILIAPVLLIARLLTARYVPYSWQTHLFPTHLRLDSLLFGVVISYYRLFHAERFSSFATRYRNQLLCLAGILIAPIFFMSQSDPWMYTYGFASLYVGFGCLLVGFLHVPLDNVWRPVLTGLRAIGYLGTFSYSIYLWHLYWVQIIEPRLPMTGYPSMRLGVYYTGAILLGIAAAKIVEIPALRLREHLFPPSAPPQSLDLALEQPPCKTLEAAEAVER